MDVRDTLWALLIQGEGSPRRQIRACASLQERLEKKTNQRCAPVREPRIVQVNLSVHWRKPEGPQALEDKERQWSYYIQSCSYTGTIKSHSAVIN